jgi:hypothetical protein
METFLFKCMGVITVTFNNISVIILYNFIDEGHEEYPVKTTKDRLYNGQKKKYKTMIYKTLHR